MEPNTSSSPNDKHSAVWQWLMTCPDIGDMFFNASRAEDGNTQLVPSDQVVSTYIDGSTLRNYNCALNRFLAYSNDPNDDSNIDAVVDLEAVASWIDAQMAAGTLPEFPGCIVNEARVLPNESGYMVAQDGALAKYMLQFQIEYLKQA